MNRGSWPILGLGAVVCGTVAAVLSIPDNPQPSGALFWPALWASIGLISIPVIRARTDTLALLRAEHVLVIGLVYWLLLDPLQGAYPLVGATYNDIVMTFVAIGVMAAGIWIGTAGLGWSLPSLVLRTAKRPFATNSLFGAVVIAFLLGMFYFAYSSDFDPVTMLNGLSACRFCAPWSRGSMGGSEAFIEHLRYFGYVLPPITVLIAQRDGWLRPRAVAGIVMSCIMIAFLAQDGGRRAIGVVVGAALITWILLQERINWKALAITLGAVACLLIFMDLMLEYRSVGFSAYGERLTPEAESILIRVDDNILRLSQIVSLFPDSHPYVNFGPLIYAMVRPIPRVFWPDKPVDPGYDLTALVGEQGLSLTHSIVGEFYAMHGIIVVLVGGIVLGRIAKMWSKLLTVEGMGKSITYGLGIMVLFAALRSMQDFVIMSYGLLAWFVIASILPQTKAANLRSA